MSVSIQKILKENVLGYLLETQILLTHVLKLSRAELYMYDDRILTTSEWNQFKAYIEKRKTGYPMAYITGEKECFGLNFFVNEHVLIPRPETELLIQCALDVLKKKPDAKTLDICTGSGVIACVLGKYYPNAQILATDISTEALIVAKKNIDAHQLKNVICRHSDGFLKISESFDLIVSNPPYIASNDPHLTGDIRFEPHNALVSGQEGLDFISRLILEAKSHLLPGGYLYIEHGYDQGEALTRLMQQNGYSDVQSFQDLFGYDRVISGFFNSREKL